MSDKFVDIGVPSYMTVQENAHQLRITRKWFDMRWIPLAPFVIAWDALSVWVCVTVFIDPMNELIFLLIPLLNVTVAGIATYLLLVCFLNTSIINVTPKVISIKNGPLPIWGNKRVASQKLLQLYCKKDVLWHHFSRITSFSVKAITSDRKNIRLLEGIGIVEQALFIEQEIERFLHIEDRPVKGEIR